MPPKKMEAKVAALESEVANLRTTLITMQERAENHQAQLLDLLTLNISKSQQEKDDVGSVCNTDTPTKTGAEEGNPAGVSGWTKLD